MTGREVEQTDSSVGEYFHVLLRADTALQTQVDMVLTLIVAYNVDAVHAHSAKVVSAHL